MVNWDVCLSVWERYCQRYEIVPQRRNGDTEVGVWLHRGVLQREVGEGGGWRGLGGKEIFVRIDQISLVHGETCGGT